MEQKYSDWIKVDLHIHTDYSNKTKPHDYNGTFDIATLKSKLNENDVQLFSLTDHNIINTEAYEDYYNNYEEGDPVLLVGCEFDINVKQDDGTYLTYHTLLIFDENSTSKAAEISERIENHFETENINIKERSLTVDQIFELFHQYHFFYIPHAGGHKNIIEAYSGTDIKKAQEMVLLMECAHEKVKEKHRVKHYAGFDKLKDPDFRNKKEEAFINFSDNHDCQNYPLPKSGTPHEFYCLKGEPTFETLRFSFIDPLSRIRKQKDVDQLKNVTKYISSLDINNLDKVNDNTIEFSPNLNVIIGGASSGKSLLFNLIGEKIENRKNGFAKYHKVTSDTLIKSSNSHTPQSSLPFDSNEVIYINQGDVIRYFEKGDLRELVKDSEKEDELLEAKSKLELRKNDLLDKLNSFKNKFDSFNSSYHKDYTIYEGDFNNMLSDKFHFKEIKARYDVIDFDERINLLDDITLNLEKLMPDEVFEFTTDENEIITQFNELIAEKQKLILEKSKLQQSIETFINSIDNIIEKQNSTLESSARAKAESFRRKGNLINTCTTLFDEANSFNKDSTLLENYNYEEKEDIKINEAVTLILEIEKELELKQGIVNCINNGDNHVSIYENYLILLKENKFLKDYPEYTDRRLIQKLQKELEGIIQKFDSPNTYLDYGENGNSKNKSPGYNSEMYLKTILQQSKCKLIMIDQPEDNLGNSFKNETLINLLRKYKFGKQIILVTHNPSIVVYGDAENVILAKNEQGQISYEQMVLERKKNQKLIIDNLDGGKAIFNMRSRKYNIKKLLNS